MHITLERSVLVTSRCNTFEAPSSWCHDVNWSLMQRLFCLVVPPHLAQNFREVCYCTKPWEVFKERDLWLGKKKQFDFPVYFLHRDVFNWDCAVDVWVTSYSSNTAGRAVIRKPFWQIPGCFSNASATMHANCYLRFNVAVVKGVFFFLNSVFFVYSNCTFMCR